MILNPGQQLRANQLAESYTDPAKMAQAVAEIYVLMEAASALVIEMRPALQAMTNGPLGKMLGVKHGTR